MFISVLKIWSEINKKEEEKPNNWKMKTTFCGKEYFSCGARIALLGGAVWKTVCFNNWSKLNHKSSLLNHYFISMMKRHSRVSLSFFPPFVFHEKIQLHLSSSSKWACHPSTSWRLLFIAMTLVNLARIGGFDIVSNAKFMQTCILTPLCSTRDKQDIRK